jgi:serine/threonine protein kinase
MNDVKPDAKAIFLEALDCKGADELRRFLDHACGTDAALRTRVEELLRAHRDAGAFLGGAEKQDATCDQPIAHGPGTVIGPYKLLEQIGEGGFGVVFMAEQTQPVRRKVALKVLKPGMDTRQVVARFEAERQALALMDHPNIAHVFDGGETAAGRPYFVMELVRGLPITDFCDDDHLPVRQRLELFVSVCQAVQHAHQKGIIHRDLKPSNILVTLHDGTPVVKVIDFGIAKALGQQLTDKTLFTNFAQLMGSPMYMSPEQTQLSGLDMDTRTDIYALGVLLYELLTGTTPFDAERLRTAAYDEVRRIIQEEEPPKPSTRLSTLGQATATVSANRRTDPKRLRQLFRGEIDWIVMKALEKDRNRRYETASAFAADVQRYLDDEPVLACPPSAGYRLRNFVRRNKGPVLAASLVALALISGITGTTLGMLHAEAARQDAVRAQQEAQEREAETRAVLDFVEKKILAAARPKGQEGGLGQVTLREAIESALPHVASSFAREPLIEARVRVTLGLSSYYLGDSKTAAEQFQAAHTIYAKQYGPDHADTLQSAHRLAVAYFGLGRHAEALALNEETLARRKAKLGPDHPDTINSMQNLAISYYKLGRYAEAVRLYEDTLALLKANPDADEHTAQATLLCTSNLALGYKALGRHDDALRLREAALALMKAKLGPHHPHTLWSMGMLADSWDEAGRHADAAKLHEEALALQKASLRPDHPETLHGMNRLATSYTALGRHAEALKLREETLALRKAKLGPDHPDTLWSMWTVADSLVTLGRGAEAVPIIDECLKRAADKIVDPNLSPRLVETRLRHFEKVKDVTGCRQTAEIWDKLKRSDARSLYSAACSRAVAAAVIRAGDKSEKAAIDADAEADRAMAWLAQAVAAGYKDLANMKKDKDLDALRGREDFKNLIATVEEKQ